MSDVRPSVRLSVVVYDHIVQQNVEIGIWEDRCLGYLHADADLDHSILYPEFYGGRRVRYGKMWSFALRRQWSQKQSKLHIRSTKNTNSKSHSANWMVLCAVAHTATGSAQNRVQNRWIRPSVPHPAAHISHYLSICWVPCLFQCSE